MVAVRASDPERESVVARLGSAAAEGRLTLAEFEERCGLAYAAMTSSDLETLTADLPLESRVDDRVSPVTLSSAPALAGGLAWMPLFPYLDFSAFLGVVGVVGGVLALRADAQGAMRVIAVLGLLGGAVGIALQLAWIAVTVT